MEKVTNQQGGPNQSTMATISSSTLAMKEALPGWLTSQLSSPPPSPAACRALPVTTRSFILWLS